MLNNDYSDMLRALSDENVKFLLVGAYAMAVHGYPRATMDLDLWVMPTAENADAVMRAITRFGAPLHNLTKADLLKDDTVFQIGVAPRRIDIITGATGLRFEDAYANSVEADIEKLAIRVPSIDDLIRNKRATGRTRDMADAEVLTALKESGPSQ
jgi:hypothetical protein